LEFAEARPATPTVRQVSFCLFRLLSVEFVVDDENQFLVCQMRLTVHFHSHQFLSSDIPW
jgi:hypothetical protein